MKEQNFKNHAKIVPIFHIVLPLVIITLCVQAIINFISAISNDNGKLQAEMFLLIAVALMISYVKIRSFPIIAQDRAIRAEENLRYFTLTGKLFDSRLTISQIIALRFAPDSELVALTDRAIKENLSNKEIKKSIQNWKADHHRA
jgi:uncharacterized membrane protein